jgi:hypothetical protein
MHLPKLTAAFLVAFVIGLIVGHSSPPATGSRPDPSLKRVVPPGRPLLQPTVQSELGEAYSQNAESNEAENPAAQGSKRPGELNAELLVKSLEGQTADPASFFKSIHLFRSLDGDSAKYLIQRYLNRKASGECDRASLSLALYMGGDDVGAFVSNELNQNSQSEESRVTLCMSLAGLEPGVCTLSQLKVDRQLFEMASRLITSEDYVERCASMGLLAHDTRPESMATLKSSLVNDADPRVRAAAAIALGKRGDDKMFGYLRDECMRMLENEGDDERRQIIFNGFQSANDILEERLLSR